MVKSLERSSGPLELEALPFTFDFKVEKPWKLLREYKKMMEEAKSLKNNRVTMLKKCPCRKEWFYFQGDKE